LTCNTTVPLFMRWALSIRSSTNIVPRNLLIALLCSTFAPLLAKNCKCLPGDSYFPSPFQWDTFAKKLSQPLISNQRPLASVCYPSSPDFSSEQCSIAAQNSTQISFIVSSTNVIDYANWEGLVTENGDVQQCTFNPAPNVTCFQGRIPSYVITATTVEDIQHTIRFALDHNLHLIVKNIGCALESYYYFLELIMNVADTS